jgi:hypothetical protein
MRHCPRPCFGVIVWVLCFAPLGSACLKGRASGPAVPAVRLDPGKASTYLARAARLRRYLVVFLRRRTRRGLRAERLSQEAAQRLGRTEAVYLLMRASKKLLCRRFERLAVWQRGYSTRFAAYQYRGRDRVAHRFRIQLFGDRLLLSRLTPHVQIAHSVSGPIPAAWLHAGSGPASPKRITTSHPMVDVHDDAILLSDGASVFFGPKQCEMARSRLGARAFDFRGHTVHVRYHRPWRVGKGRDSLARVIGRRGKIYWAVRDQSGTHSCQTWRFRPGNSARSGALYRFLGGRDRVSYGYYYDGRVIRLYGPNSEWWIRGKRHGMSTLCFSDYVIREMSTQRVRLDRLLGVPGAWYLSRRACLQAITSARRSARARRTSKKPRRFTAKGLLSPRICGSG